MHIIRLPFKAPIAASIGSSNGQYDLLTCTTCGPTDPNQRGNSWDI